MFCSKCGSQIPEGAAFCVNCGQSVAPAPERSQPEAQQPQYQYSQPQYTQQPQPQYNQPQYNQYGYQNTPEQDAPNTGFAIISFFVPIVVIILYCIWRDQLPQKAKSCLHGALAQIIICAVLTIFSIVFAFLIPVLGMM